MSQQPPINQPQWGQQIPPYQQQPGQFQRPPFNNYLPPRRQTGIWQWYKSRTKKVKLSIGCGTILALLLFFLCIGTVVGSVNLASQSTPTPTTPNNQAAILVSPSVTHVLTPSPTPTQKPTPTSTPKPTIAPTHTPLPTQPPKPTSPPCQATNGNPWCYNFVPGKLIYYPPSGFCKYFACISSLYGSDDPGDGYIVQCNDGSYSQSGGEKGACSYHNGVMRPLYAH
jgi:hypothetical protein